MNDENTGEERALREAIVRREAELENALKNLVHAANNRASLGHYVGRYPWQFLVGGVLLGAWLGRR